MNPAEYSLADFFYSDTDDPTRPPPEFAAWREAGAWAMSLMEPALHGPAVPRVEIHRAGHDQKVINLSSYNYMGMAHHPEVVEAAKMALEKYGVGACGSPLLSGLSDLHRELEEKLAAFMGREAVMLYNSGFGAAMGALAGMLRKGDVAILDAKCHLCALDGAALSKAKRVFFDHNDPASLDDALTKSEGKRRLVVLEGVYSMDGDVADLPALMEVTRRHKASVFIDEAHSLLVYGKKGRGVAEHFNAENDIAVMFGTFSKSFAGVGGFVAAKKDLVDYLRYYSNPYGFSCALPPSVVAALLKVLEIFQRDDSLQKRLWENTEYFRSQLIGMGVNIGESTSQVVPIVIGADRLMLYQLCHEMNERGLFLAPVDYPSVPEGQLRFRSAVTAAHTRQDLDDALQIIEDTVVKRLKEQGA
ncbi:MAG: aminotransferase class I/II-fold pyridoxal phosphate-dependent enzyme [Myxococcales bacterium]|nr:aminotransferase class I/II-fold pyridoxal phosphate-dependent enzyme [Myxococcales bacterium]MCB9643882.1 aminotransferase class I/II-fold pyridoxal phosphate-dependent enzyme [Myxococcales bacterium]